MKIAVIAPTHIPANSANTIQVMKMAQAFVSLGIEVDLAYPGAPSQAGRSSENWDQLANHYGLQHRFPIVELPCGPRARKYDYAWRSVRWARGSGASLVYTRLLQAAALASLASIPTILELHDLPTGKMGPGLVKLFLRGRGRRRLSLISTTLKTDLTLALDLPPEGDLIMVAPDGVDLSRYADVPPPEQARRVIGPALCSVLGNQRPAFQVERFTAGYSGHLYPGRGVELMLDLAARLPEVNFLLMGGEPEEVDKIQERVAERGLENLILTGFIPNAELPKYQAACDVLLMPYQHKVAASSGGDIARYLSPMKLFEYLACGRAILSSDLPVLREVLALENAVLLPPDDLDRWVEAILQMQMDAERRLVLGARARQDSKQYSWEARAERLLAGLSTIAQPGWSDQPIR